MADLTPRQKLVKARLRLLEEQPFFGVLSTYLQLREDKRIRTAAVTETLDTLLYNPDFIEGLNDKQTEFLFAHEVLHLVLDHFDRRGDRNDIAVTPDGEILPLWNIATDYAVNSVLVEEGVGEMPEGGLHDPSFAKQDAEKIYEQIKSTARTVSVPSPDGESGEGDGDGDGEGGGGDGDQSSGGGQGQSADGEDQSSSKKEGYKVENGTLDQHPDLNKADKLNKTDKSSSSSSGKSDQKTVEDLKREWLRRAVSAAQVAKQQGKLPAGLETLVEALTTPQVDWRAYLARFLRSAAKDDYSYSHPDRRFVSQGIYMPDLHTETCEIVVAVDTSGSISNEELTQFLSEVAEISATIPSIRLHLICCDAEVQSYQVFEGYEAFDFREVKLKGRGGTDFRPVFDFIEENAISPDALVYLTDGYGDYPQSEPDYPVLWVISADGTNDVPFGDSIRLEGTK